MGAAAAALRPHLAVGGGSAKAGSGSCASGTVSVNDASASATSAASGSSSGTDEGALPSGGGSNAGRAAAAAATTTKAAPAAPSVSRTMTGTGPPGVKAAAGSAAPRRGTPLRDTVAACQADWFAEEVEEAESGNPVSMALVGQMLMQGYGCPRDVLRGRAWVERALQTAAGVPDYAHLLAGWRHLADNADSQPCVERPAAPLAAAAAAAAQLQPQQATAQVQA